MTNPQQQFLKFHISNFKCSFARNISKKILYILSALCSSVVPFAVKKKHEWHLEFELYNNTLQPEKTKVYY